MEEVVLTTTPSSLTFAQGGEAVVESVATGAAQARQVTLQRDAEGAINILRRLDTPAAREYRALRIALHTAKAVAFLTQQTRGLGLGYMSGTGFVVKRLDGPRFGRTPTFSAPSYFRTRALCLGAVAGFEYTQSLLVFTSDEELHHFIDGEGFVGATVSVTAGSDMLRNLAARPKKVARTQSNTLVFTIAAGALANLSLKVGWTASDHAMNRKLFGTLTLFGTNEITPRQLLSGLVESPVVEFRPLYCVLQRYAMRRPYD